MARTVAPLNTITRHVVIKEMNDDGVLVPVTSGTWTMFLATSNAADAATADAALSVSMTYEGGANDLAAGTWQGKILGSSFTLSLYDTHFASQGYGYLIVQNSTQTSRQVELVNVKEALPAEIG